MKGGLLEGVEGEERDKTDLCIPSLAILRFVVGLHFKGRPNLGWVLDFHDVV